MADDAENKESSGFDFHKMVTSILAIVTFGFGVHQYLQQQAFQDQNQVLNELQKEFDNAMAERKQLVAEHTLVDELLTRIETYLDKQSKASDGQSGDKRVFDEKDRLRIMISLQRIAIQDHLDRVKAAQPSAQPGTAEGVLATETQANKTPAELQAELFERQEELLRSIPIRFAMLADDASMLVELSQTKNGWDVARWLSTAKTGADPDIKATAANALSWIALTTQATEIEKRAEYLESLTALARDATDLNGGNRDNPAVAALQRVYDTFKADTLPGSEQGEAEGEGGDQLQPLLDMALVHLSAPSTPVADQAPNTEGYDPDSNQPEESGGSSPAMPAAPTPVRHLVTATPHEIQVLLTNLNGSDPSTRRSARDKLADIGAEAVPGMMVEYAVPGDRYRIRLGILVALTKMLRISDPGDQRAMAERLSEFLTEADLKRLVDAIDVADKTMRQYATEFLYDLGDERTASLLLKIAEDSDRDTSLYQAVFVLGNVLHRLPPDAEERKDAPQRLKGLKREIGPKTAGLIARLLDQVQ